MISSSRRGWKKAVSSGLRYAAILCFTASLTAVAHAQSLRAVPSAIKTAGTGGHGFNNDFGPASGVELNAPSTNLFDAQGNQYISDAGNNCVRRVDLSGSVTTIVGLDQAGPGDTCNSSLNPTPTAAQGLLSPTGLAIDAGGTLYVADTGHNCVRKLAGGTAGVITAVTAVGNCSGTSLSPAPFGLVIDEAGNLLRLHPRCGHGCKSGHPPSANRPARLSMPRRRRLHLRWYPRHAQRVHFPLSIIRAALRSILPATSSSPTPATNAYAKSLRLALFRPPWDCARMTEPVPTPRIQETREGLHSASPGSFTSPARARPTSSS